MNRPSYRATQIQVRYSETDQMGVVYHANYLSWFEVGRTDYMRGSEVSYRELEELGVLLPVTDASISYKQPARYDDVLEIRTQVREVTPVRIEFAYEIYRLADECLLVTGTTKHAFTTRELRPVRLSRLHPEVYAWLEKQQTGV